MPDTALVLFGDVIVADELAAPVADTVLDRMRLWSEALDLFLSSRRAENTRRSYRRSLQEFLAYGGKMPWEVGRDDVQRWVDALRKNDLTKETINLKVAALSSFFSFCMNEYEITTPEGRRTSLASYNPASAKSLRSKVVPYGKAIYLSPEEVRALLSAIRQDTVQGLRDFALFLAYIFTARRNSEIRLLKWGDFSRNGERMMYRWSGKGKADEKYELPAPVWAAIQAYLKAAGRMDAMQDGDYIFTPLNDHALRLANVAPQTWTRNRPISMRQAGSLLKKYCRRAGLDAKKIHVHTLRHTGAHLRSEAGDSIQDICEFLAHSSVAITQIYLTRTEGKKDTSWRKVEALIGL